MKYTTGTVIDDWKLIDSRPEKQIWAQDSWTIEFALDDKQKYLFAVVKNRGHRTCRYTMAEYLTARRCHLLENPLMLSDNEFEHLSEVIYKYTVYSSRPEDVHHTWSTAFLFVLCMYAREFVVYDTN